MRAERLAGYQRIMGGMAESGQANRTFNAGSNPAAAHQSPGKLFRLQVTLPVVWCNTGIE